MVCLHCARKCFCFVLLQVGHRLWYIELTIIIDFRFASHQLAKPIPNAQCSKQTNTICTCKLRFACWVLKNWLTCFSIGNEEVLHEPGNNTEGMCSVRKAKTTALNKGKIHTQLTSLTRLPHQTADSDTVSALQCTFILLKDQPLSSGLPGNHTRQQTNLMAALRLHHQPNFLLVLCLTQWLSPTLRCIIA